MSPHILAILKSVLDFRGRSSPASFVVLGPLFAIAGLSLCMATWSPLGFEDLSRKMPTGYTIMLTVASYLLFCWPLLAFAFRRAQDVGRAGPILALPAVFLLPATLWSVMHFLPSGGRTSDTEIMVVKGILVASPLVALTTFVIGIWPFQPGPNKYGPNPHEVSQ